MPLCIDIQSLLIAIAVILIQQSASPTNAQSNFALYQEITVSSNNTCGLQEKDEFCAAIDQPGNCRQFDLCNTGCFFADTSPGKLDLVATGMFHGEVTYKNIMPNTSQCRTFIYLWCIYRSLSNTVDKKAVLNNFLIIIMLIYM